MPAAERGVGVITVAHTALLLDAALVMSTHALHASTCFAVSPLAMPAAERGVGVAAVAHTALLLDAALVLGTMLCMPALALPFLRLLCQQRREASE